jgi:hypothetical protein
MLFCLDLSLSEFRLCSQGIVGYDFCEHSRLTLVSPMEFTYLHLHISGLVMVLQNAIVVILPLLL